MFLRPVRTSQPQGPARIDWSNPITKGLVSSFLPGVADRDLVSGGGFTYEGGDKSISITRYGPSANTLPARINTGAAPKFLEDLSFLWLGSLNAFPGINGQVFNQRTSFTDGGLSVSFGFSGSSSIVFSAKGATNGTLSISHAAVGYSPGQSRPIVGRVAGTTQELFIGGVLLGSRVNTIPMVNQAIPIYFGALSTGGNQLNALHTCLHVFNRALSDSEVKSLTDNPWQVFAPDNKSLWVPAAVSVSLPTLVRPTSTISAGLWVPTGAATLHETIDEEFHVDADYMSVNAASTVELELAEAAFPGGANQTLAYWASSTQGSTLTVTLKQGATQIMTRTHTLTATDTLYTQTLTAPEIALITAGAIQVTLTTS